MIIHFLFLAPSTFINLQPNLSLLYGMDAIGGVAVAIYTVSTYGRVHNAAMRLGFNDDIDTYLLISSKLTMHSSN